MICSDASYDKRTGQCFSSKGTIKYYTASDNLHKVDLLFFFLFFSFIFYSFAFHIFFMSDV